MKTLLDADYIERDGKAVIRLFYKTENGREIEEIEDFRPYFYAIPEDGKIRELKREIQEIENVISVEEERKIDVQKEIDVLRITVKLPRDVPKIREIVKELKYCKETREAHIPFAERYLINSGLVPMKNSEEINLKIAAFDIEVYNPRGEPNSEVDPILMISYSDSMGMRRVWTHSIDGIDLKFLEILENEREIIKKFVDTIREREIDIIVTYNGDNFDFPYLKERGRRLNVPIEIGIDGSQVKLERRGMNLGARVRGRPHIDLFPISRQIFNLSKYTLEDVYLEITGREKLDIRVGEMAEIWDSGDREKIKEILKYSMSDADATLEIALELLPLHYALSRITGELIYQSSRAGSGQRVESLLMRKAYERGILFPNKPSDQIVGERQRMSYIGGYVLEPERGIHDNLILFDFRSLYPSIIISYNIDPGTIDCECCKDDSYKTPTGHHFCKKRKGFIPEILKELIERRMKIKNKLAVEKDLRRRKFLDVKQYALKILANSMYGYFGFPRARWYSRECAEATAALGREYIKRTINEVERNGFRAVYGDTDSVYIVLPNETKKEKIVERAKSLLEKINSRLPEAMELEFEGFYPRGIFITKKRYALIDEFSRLIVKGLETRRRDWANIAKETQNNVLMAILHDKNPEKAASIVKDVIRRIKNGEVSLEDLAINTQITRGIGDYVQAGPHIAAAKKAMKRGLEFKRGDIVTYVITKKGSSISDKAEVIDFVKEGDYDSEYYINNQVLPAVLRILEALGYSEDELKGLGKQTTLDLF